MEIDKEYLDKFEVADHSVSEEYQEICVEAVEYFGKPHSSLLWSLPWRKGVSDQKLRHALEECKKRKIKNIRYLLGILNNV